MGEYQQDVMDLKGSTFELAHRNSQASVPFVVSSAGYGFLWNNPAIGQATFALNRTEWRADSARQIDYWVTAGDTPAAIERNYANATGHSPMMPEWGLGFWQCKLRYWNQEQLLEVAREFRRRGIPLDLIVIDFFHWPHMGDFSFEREFWPDPKAMCDELHEMGIKLMVSVWPQVAIESENYAEMKSRNLLVMAEKGEDIGMMFEGPSQFFDATNPAARKYVWDKCRANYADLGVDAFWLDEAEPEYGSYDFENYRYYAGSNQQIGNIFFTKYIKIREQLRPYTRELFADAHENGQPLIRGLFYEFPKDLNTADISDEYMFGPDLLVAPVTEFSARKRTVYLPGEASTIWTNLLDGTETTGGQSIVVHAPLESIPVFARNGNDHDLLGKL